MYQTLHPTAHYHNLYCQYLFILLIKRAATDVLCSSSSDTESGLFRPILQYLGF